MSAYAAALEAAWYRGARWLWLLRPVEFLFRCLARTRRFLYQRGWLTIYRAGRPVVVVGNITVGGTGKTPVVIALVETMQAQGLKPGVVSRGYGATAGNYPHRVTPASTANDCGDEPLLIYRRTACPCVVDPDRAAAVKLLLSDDAIDLVICDDGLQHYALARDLEIVVLDGQRGIGNGFCLPAGPLREPESRLKSVDQVLYRGSEDPQNGFFYNIDALVNIVSGEANKDKVAPGVAQDIEVYAVAGIGQPQQFFQTLETLGYKVLPTIFPDHHVFTGSDFQDLQDRPLIMTEKDAVKCAGLVGPDAWFLRISARLPSRLQDTVISIARGRV